jgi:hypothetical protein
VPGVKPNKYEHFNIMFMHENGTVVVVIVWKCDLQLPVQSVPITTETLSSNPTHGVVYSIQHFVIKFVSDLQLVFKVGGFWFLTPFSTIFQLYHSIGGGKQSTQRKTKTSHSL